MAASPTKNAPVPAGTPAGVGGSASQKTGGEQPKMQESPQRYRERMEELKQRILDLSKRNEDITIRILREWMKEPKAK